MKPIVFIGMMGSGKTTIGHALAKKLHKTHIDLDEWIEAQQQMSVTKLFQTQGEAYFRQCEVQALKEVLLQYEIISPGGGIILNPNNRELLKQMATVIYLKATPQTLLTRVTSSNRPLLQDGNVEEKLSTILSKRQALYEETAHYEIETDHLTVDDVIEQILKLEKA
ncbi:MAG TPA: shikimate kinase [Firmicutes bacterium]|nr:shikimate kinase [Bacillota bacterium]